MATVTVAANTRGNILGEDDLDGLEGRRDAAGRGFRAASASSLAAGASVGAAAVGAGRASAGAASGRRTAACAAASRRVAASARSFGRSPARVTVPGDGIDPVDETVNLFLAQGGRFAVRHL